MRSVGSAGNRDRHLSVVVAARKPAASIAVVSSSPVSSLARLSVVAKAMMASRFRSTI